VLAAELVVNIHLTERCNFRCKFCFAKWVPETSSSSEVFTNEASGPQVLLELLRALLQGPGRERPVRVTFVGGEPGLVRTLPSLVRVCRDLGVRTSFVTNGLMFRYPIEWISRNFDVAGISIDSSNPATSIKIGRASRSGDLLDIQELAVMLRDLTRLSPILIKVNTVVSSWNHDEYLGEVIELLQPDKWKIFQMLPIHGDSGQVSKEQFAAFVHRHRKFREVIVSEDNDLMTGSYLMIDPLGRFFWRTGHLGYSYSRPIREVGVLPALAEVPIDWGKYADRYPPPRQAWMRGLRGRTPISDAGCTQPRPGSRRRAPTAEVMLPLHRIG
jgi:radical S-adenosyl methionine domain-containing protein 2